MDKNQILEQSFDVVRKTIEEVNLIKNDLEKLLSDVDPILPFNYQYSQSGSSLYLKPYHYFTFRNTEKDPEDDAILEDQIFIMHVIFYDKEPFKRLSLEEGAEIWFGYIDISSPDNKDTWWGFEPILKSNNLDEFSGGRPMIGGNVSEYIYKKEGSSEEWNGKFIGYPLTDIKDIQFLQDNVIDKILPNK